MYEICSEHYPAFLAKLKALVSLRSVTTDDDAVQVAIEHCQRDFSASLSPLGWTVECDEAGNLRCVPPAVSTSDRVLWLNAHIDTVGAAPAR